MDNSFPWRYTVLYDPPSYGYPYNTNSRIMTEIVATYRGFWCIWVLWRYPCGVIVIDNKGGK